MIKSTNHMLFTILHSIGCDLFIVRKIRNAYDACQTMASNFIIATQIPGTFITKIHIFIVYLESICRICLGLGGKTNHC
jgi:hypothetical protein